MKTAHELWRPGPIPRESLRIARDIEVRLGRQISEQECLSHNREDLSSDASTGVKSQAWRHICTGLGRWDRNRKVTTTC